MNSSAPSTKNMGLNPTEAIGAYLLGVFLASGFLMYLAGEISGIVFKFDRPGAKITDIPKIVFGVLSHPGNPSLGYPKEIRQAIPNAFFYYLTLLILIAGAIYATKFLRDAIGSGKKKDPNAAQWAKSKDIKTLIVPGPGIKGRLVLGRSNGKMIATEPRQSVIVLGPTQTGKTTGFAVPAILDWQGPVIAASVKNDLVKDTFKWRQSQGEVWLFDPTRATGFDYEDVRAGWSPLSQAIDWGGARKVASWLAKANKAAGGGLSDGDFWFSIAEKALAPYLFAASYGGLDMATVLRWIDTMEEREVLNILQTTGVPEAMTAFRANMARDERTKSSVFTTAETIVNAYNDPLVCESAANPTIFASELLNGKNNTLYICAPSHEQDRLQTIFTAIVTQMKSSAYELAGKQNKIIDPPLLIVIDEAANIAPLDDLDAIASTAAGIGIQLVTIFQDMAQIEARYKERARTVVNNHRAKVVLSGISDAGTLEYVTKLIGEEEIDSTSVSYSAQGERSTTESMQQRTLASGSFLRRMKFGEGIVVYGQLAPAKLVLRAWYKDKDLKHKVEHGTLPGAIGGKAGSNYAGSAPGISKPQTSIPSVDSILTDSRARSQGNETNQTGASSGAPGSPKKWSTDSSGPAQAYSTPVTGGTPEGGTVPGAGGFEAQHRPTPAIPGVGAGTRLSEPVSGDQLSAFDKALAELRLRDQGGMPSDTGQTPVTPTATGGASSFSPTTGGGVQQSEAVVKPAVQASPAKWKPSSGGIEESKDEPSSVAKTPAFDGGAQQAEPVEKPAPQASTSKWSKASKPVFVDQPIKVDQPKVQAPTTAQAPTATQGLTTQEAPKAPQVSTTVHEEHLAHLVTPVVAPITRPVSTWGASNPAVVPQQTQDAIQKETPIDEVKPEEENKEEQQPKSKWK